MGSTPHRASLEEWQRYYDSRSRTHRKHGKNDPVTLKIKAERLREKAFVALSSVFLGGLIAGFYVLLSH
ncbi:MAG TPA: hypothetical protein VK989_18035 [Polyangia bacterium]|jgi:hypothetical protein|nr:hypothetical protein [Polyangia bacterium]